MTILVLFAGEGGGGYGNEGGPGDKFINQYPYQLRGYTAWGGGDIPPRFEVERRD